MVPLLVRVGARHIGLLADDAGLPVDRDAAAQGQVTGLDIQTIFAVAASANTMLPVPPMVCVPCERKCCCCNVDRTVERHAAR